MASSMSTWYEKLVNERNTRSFTIDWSPDRNAQTSKNIPARLVNLEKITFFDSRCSDISYLTSSRHLPPEFNFANLFTRSFHGIIKLTLSNMSITFENLRVLAIALRSLDELRILRCSFNVQDTISSLVFSRLAKLKICSGQNTLATVSKLFYLTFSQLHTLELDCQSDTAEEQERTYEDIFSNCRSLKKMILGSELFPSEITSRTLNVILLCLPQLEELCFSPVRTIDWPNRWNSTFLGQHFFSDSLKKLHCSFLTKEDLHLISIKLRQLQELHVGTYDDGFDKVCTMDSVRKLSVLIFDGHRQQYTMRVPSAATAISHKMSKLKKLTFNDKRMSEIRFYYSIEKRLLELEELHLFCDDRACAFIDPLGILSENCPKLVEVSVNGYNRKQYLQVLRKNPPESDKKNISS